jgi:hypothetical protein
LTARDSTLRAREMPAWTGCHDSSAVPGVYVTQHTTTSPDGSTGWVYSNDSGNTVSLSNTFQTIGQDPVNPNPISALGVTTRGVVSDGQANFSADSGVLNQGDTWSSNPQSLTYGLGPQYSIGQASNTPATIPAFPIQRRRTTLSARTLRRSNSLLRTRCQLTRSILILADRAVRSVMSPTPTHLADPQSHNMTYALSTSHLFLMPRHIS